MKMKKKYIDLFYNAQQCDKSHDQDLTVLKMMAIF